jgi:hypothetical protein
MENYWCLTADREHKKQKASARILKEQPVLSILLLEQNLYVNAITWSSIDGMLEFVHGFIKRKRLW